MHSVTPRLERLRENEFDLQVELNDLADEIASRYERLAVVLHLLHETRRELLVLEDLPC